MIGRMRAAAAALAAAGVLAACDETPVACPDILRPALRVTPIGLGGQNVTVGAEGWFVTRNFADSLRHGFGDEHFELVGYGPAGSYSVIVSHPDYATWSRTDVRVREGEGGCGVETVELVADLASPRTD